MDDKEGVERLLTTILYRCWLLRVLTGQLAAEVAGKLSSELGMLEYLQSRQDQPDAVKLPDLAPVIEALDGLRTKPPAIDRYVHSQIVAIGEGLKHYQTTVPK